jgi:hypothetical protein
LEIAARFPQASTAIFIRWRKQKDKHISRLRASRDSDDTQSAYRVAAFHTFLSGRISTFGDKMVTLANRCDGCAVREEPTQPRAASTFVAVSSLGVLVEGQ